MDKILKIEFKSTKNGHEFCFYVSFGVVSYDDAVDVLKEISLELEQMREEERKKQEKAQGDIDGGV